MKFQFLNKTFKNKRFDYSPMYYDERKERLELKKKEFDKLSDESLSSEERKSILRSNMQQTWVRSQQAQKQKHSSNLRVLILIGVLLALGYFIFNGVNEVDTVVKKLW
jgi:sensor domain CHASE-containing protein|tara:strand:+ start:18812 stop:19135 length:324 start_codon:yes stop_codon:yes gene_type:complete